MFLFYLAVGLIEKLQANRCDIGLSFDSTASLLFSFALFSDCFLAGLAELAFAGGIFAGGVFGGDVSDGLISFSGASDF